jgi:hypothetical protein
MAIDGDRNKYQGDAVLALARRISSTKFADHSRFHNRPENSSAQFSLSADDCIGDRPLGRRLTLTRLHVDHWSMNAVVICTKPLARRTLPRVRRSAVMEGLRD